MTGTGNNLNGLRLVAVFEALKGALVLLVGCGLLAFIHKDLHDAAEQLVRALHFNPARHYPRVFIDATANISNTELWVLSLSAFLYSAVRFAEAYGLWLKLQWAEWFGLLSGGIYIPVEMYEVARELTWARVAVLTVNTLIVLYLAYILLRSRGSHRRRDD
ncbi:DUF2127 domain-containing protein [Geomonas sp. RF6]|uniref:DUF2127 domain-containing protein n=1 Tax=Geomonas sp. RF6 TaxID=2897342 RepID=UPI001E38C938|nr:DUF2127 domain-containing protein [Geomonas sp. RF6]UFS72372.1 DUF2127 domain-containing protein [Geomonas sp. RF6]